MNYLISAGPQILEGLAMTIALTVGAFTLALALGTLMAICRILPVPVLRGVGAVYVEGVRNLPLLVILIFFVFGLPDAGLKFPLVVCMILGMGIYSGTYVCETVRSGILSVPRGEIEAARSLGMGVTKTLRLLVLPVAFKNMVQPLANILISTALSTSLAATLGVNELVGVASRIQEQSAALLLTFVVIGLGYAAITITVEYSAGRLQKRLSAKPTQRKAAS